MGRAPNSGAPQRVSAHVVPKAQAAFVEGLSTNGFSPDEEEKTTIESGWEEEASTTVEQGEVAEKIRSLAAGIERRGNITNVTSTNAGGMDEPTVDDQRANAALSMITPPSILARLVITHGNDTGQEVEIIPGKSYTIGRAIDNDVVLTDIAVSRKHFDLRNEAGVWVLVDRGSGNGTLINGNLEDQPFRLANGDAIEIGNTTFRFEFPNGMPRNAFGEQPATNGFGDIQTTNGTSFEIEEEEPSTVAAKPLSHQQPATALPIDAPPPMLRPKTVPPPLPRPRPPTRPPIGAEMWPSGSQGPSIAPVAAPMAPTLAPHLGMPALQPPPMVHHPALAHAAHHGMLPMQHAPSTTLPMPQLAQPRHPAMLADPMGSPAPMLMHSPLANMMPTTIPGQGPPMHPQQPHVQPLPFTYPNVADHAHAARMMVVTNLPGRDATSTAHVPPTPYGAPVMAMTPTPSRGISRRTKLIFGGAGLTIAAAVLTIVIIRLAGGGKDDVPLEVPQPAPSKPIVQSIETQKPPKRETPKQDPPKQQVKQDPPKQDPKQVAKQDPPKQDPPKQDPPKQDPKQVAKQDPPKQDPPKQDLKKDPPKQDPKQVAKQDPPKQDPKKDPKVDKRNIAKRDPKKDRPTPPPPKRVAVNDSPPPERPSGGDVNAKKAQGESLFRAKKFNEAAAYLKNAAAGFTGGEATDLSNQAALYSQFGRAYSVGMAPQTTPAQAWTSLRAAENFDRGGVFKDEIEARISQISAKAAMSFAGQGDYSKALQAVKIAEAAGAAETARIVRGKIEDYANQLYNDATKEAQSNPKDAKSKLQQVKSLVSPSSQLYAKAAKLLATM